MIKHNVCKYIGKTQTDVCQGCTKRDAMIYKMLNTTNTTPTNPAQWRNHIHETSCAVVRVLWSAVLIMSREHNMIQMCSLSTSVRAKYILIGESRNTISKWGRWLRASKECFMWTVRSRGALCEQSVQCIWHTCEFVSMPIRRRVFVFQHETWLLSHRAGCRCHCPCLGLFHQHYNKINIPTTCPDGWLSKFKFRLLFEILHAF